MSNASKPLGSVVTIFLDEEKFIEEAIQSVLAQRYDNWELLLVDDGSTNASTRIARGYAQRVQCLLLGGLRRLDVATAYSSGVSWAEMPALGLL